jgi:ABC-type nitrate/sulfonate/bicarbonate transport system substrate-binding protein
MPSALRMAGLIAAAASCLVLSRPAPAQDAKVTEFASAVFQSEVYLPDFVAKDKGFAAKHGLDLKFVTPQSGVAAAQLMLAGAVQGWGTDPLIILTAASKGNNVKLAGIATPVMAYTVMVSKTGEWPAEGSSFADRIKALKGKRIGVSGIGAGTDHALILMLQAVGLSEKDVTRIGIGEQQAAIGQLSGGAIDAFVSFSLSGNAIIQQQTGARRYVATFDADVPQSIRDLPFTCFAVAGDFAAKNPKTVADWLAAEADAIAWIRANPDGAAEVLNAHVFNGQQLDLAKKIIPEMIKIYFEGTPPAFTVYRKTFDLLAKAGEQLGSFPSGSTPTYGDTVITASQSAN